MCIGIFLYFCGLKYFLKITISHKANVQTSNLYSIFKTCFTSHRYFTNKNCIRGKMSKKFLHAKNVQNSLWVNKSVRHFPPDIKYDFSLNIFALKGIYSHIFQRKLLSKNIRENNIEIDKRVNFSNIFAQLQQNPLHQGVTNKILFNIHHMIFHFV